MDYILAVPSNILEFSVNSDGISVVFVRDHSPHTLRDGHVDNSAYIAFSKDFFECSSFKELLIDLFLHYIEFVHTLYMDSEYLAVFDGFRLFRAFIPFS